MKKYFCDRCGIEIPRRGYKFYGYDMDGDGKKGMRWEKVVLCEKCAEVYFKAWLKNEENDIGGENESRKHFIGNLPKLVTTSSGTFLEGILRGAEGDDDKV